MRHRRRPMALSWRQSDSNIGYSSKLCKTACSLGAQLERFVKEPLYRSQRIPNSISSSPKRICQLRSCLTQVSYRRRKVPRIQFCTELEASRLLKRIRLWMDWNWVATRRPHLLLLATGARMSSKLAQVHASSGPESMPKCEYQEH